MNCGENRYLVDANHILSVFFVVDLVSTFASVTNFLFGYVLVLSVGCAVIDDIIDAQAWRKGNCTTANGSNQEKTGAITVGNFHLT